MTDDHDWHVFDAEQNLEVCRIGNMWHVRRVNSKKSILLDDDEWEQLREAGPNPEVIGQL